MPGSTVDCFQRSFKKKNQLENAFKSSPTSTGVNDWRAIYKGRIKPQANDHVRIWQAFEIFQKENIVDLKMNASNLHGDVV